MPRTMLKTLSRCLPVFDFLFVVVAMILVMPFLASRSTIDPGLTPRFLLWSIVLFVVLVSFSIQASTGTLLVHREVQRHGVLVLFLGYLLSCLVSLLQATNLGEGLYDSAKVFMSVVFLLVSIIILGRKSTCILDLGKAVVISAMVFAIIGFHQYAVYNSVSTFRHFAMTGTMGNKNLFASALFLMLPYCLYVGLRSRGFWRLASVSATGAIVMAILLSRTRAVWLALAVSGILTTALWLLRVRRYGMRFSGDIRRRLLRGACQLLIVIVVLGGSAGLLSLRIHSGMSLGQSAFDKESIIQRLVIWKKTLAMIGDHWMWGVGIGNWKIALPSYGIPEGSSPDWFKTVFCVRPHNDSLWVLSETGVIGFCFYVSIFVVLLYYLLRLARHRTSGDDSLLSLLMFFGITGYLVISMFCFPRERVLHSVFLVLMVAVVHIVYQRNFTSARPCRLPVFGGLWVLSLLLLPAVTVLGYVRFNAEHHIRHALSARAAGDYRTVIAEVDEAYSRFATLDPTSTPLMWYRGESHFLSNKYSEALDDYRRALADHPYHVHVLNNLATCYQVTGNRDQAIHYYEKLLHIFPRFAEATCNLAAVYFNAGECQRAWDVLAGSGLASENALVERYRRIVADRLETRGVSVAAETTVYQNASAREPISCAAGGSLRSLHRLWSATHGRYFYTVDCAERDAFLARQDETWIYEGADSYVFADSRVAGLSPVYRFYSPEFRAYLYTIQPTEVQALRESHDGRWRYEGISFYAFPAGWQPADTSPVYRFWSGSLRYHLFTIGQKEKDNLQTRYSDIWTYEGIGWYAYR